MFGDPAPGDPGVVERLAHELDGVADDAADACAAVRSLAGDQAVLAWIGASGDVFRDAIGSFPGQLDKLHVSYSLAAGAVRSWAVDLRHAQDQADRALATGREARHDVDRLRGQVDGARAVLHRAASSLDTLQYAATGPLAPTPEQVRAAVHAHQVAQADYARLSAGLESAQAQLDAANRLAEQARQLREGAADRAASRIHQATDAGIPPDSFWHKVGEIASAVWHGVIVLAKIVVGVAGDGSVVGDIQRGVTEARSAWRSGNVALDASVAAGDLPALGAVRWQRGDTYGGTDLWRTEVAPAGTRFESLSPGFSGFVAPEGTFASLGHDSSAINQGLQIAPGVPDGAGGLPQHFVPNLGDRVAAGDFAVFGADGKPITVGHDAQDRLALLVDKDHLIPLTNLDLPDEIMPKPSHR